MMTDTARTIPRQLSEKHAILFQALQGLDTPIAPPLGAIVGFHCFVTFHTQRVVLDRPRVMVETPNQGISLHRMADLLINGSSTTSANLVYASLCDDEDMIIDAPSFAPLAHDQAPVFGLLEATRAGLMISAHPPAFPTCPQRWIDHHVVFLHQDHTTTHHERLVNHTVERWMQIRTLKRLDRAAVFRSRNPTPSLPHEDTP